MCVFELLKYLSAWAATRMEEKNSLFVFQICRRRFRQIYGIRWGRSTADHRPFFRFLRRQLAAELWQTCRRNFWNFQGTMIAWRHILGVFLADFQNNIILLTAVARYKFPQELTFCLQGIVWVNKHVIAAKLLVLAALALCSTKTLEPVENLLPFISASEGVSWSFSTFV